MTSLKLSLMCCPKAQPDDEDDLIEGVAVAPPPRPRSPVLEPPQLRHRPVGQRVYREEPEFEPQRRVLRFQYVDDAVEVQVPDEPYAAPPASPGPELMVSLELHI